MPRYFVLFGGPGAGKGTQAQILQEQFSLPQVSSGDLFRDNLKRETELGKLAKQYMDKGELVPDDVTIRMIRERLARPDAKNGVLLDGFPRTVPQAEALESLLAEFGGRVNAVLYIKVRDNVLLERLGGRWICRGPEQHMYHVIFSPPKIAGKCDVDGAELYQRADDTPDVHAKRIKVFFDQTAPLIEFYRQRGQLVEVDGEQPIAGVTAALKSAVEAAAAK